MTRAAIAVLVASALASCGGNTSKGAAATDAGLLCKADLGLTAWAREMAPAGVTVYGTTSAPDGVTVRAIDVAAEMVTQSTFNFRTWSIDLSAEMVGALARNGQARIPVMAYSSSGCQILFPAAEPLVMIDASVEDTGSGTSDGGTDAGPDSASGVSDALGDRPGELKTGPDGSD